MFICSDIFVKYHFKGGVQTSNVPETGKGISNVFVVNS